MQFAIGVKKNKRKHLRQNREGAILPFGAGVQYNKLNAYRLRAYLKTVNKPKQRVFSACCAPFSLVIHKVFLRKNGFSRRKIPRCWSYSRFSDRP